ncbi:MAG: hypothetical protein WCP97_07885 [bacterium]
MKTPLQTNCTCNHVGYVVLEDSSQEYKTRCKGCGKTIYGVNCEPGCSAGYAFPEDSAEINTENNTWRCSLCNKQHPLQVQHLKDYPSYNIDELPDDVRKEVERTVPKPRFIKMALFIAAIIVLVLIRLAIAK